MAARIGPVTGASAVANTHAPVHCSDRTDPNDGLGLTVLASRDNLLSVVGGHLREGSFLAPSTDRLPTVVLGHQAASRLGAARLVRGQQAPQVYIGTTWFTVIGIIDPLPLAADLDRAVLVGWGAAQRNLAFDGRPSVVYVKAREDAVEAVASVLPATLYPQLPGLVQVSRPVGRPRGEASDGQRLLHAVPRPRRGGAAGGRCGRGNTMYISVLERRQEIGLRRALGANRVQIRRQCLTESVVLSLLGGVAGTAVGVLATVGYAAYQGWPAVVPLQVLAAGTGGAMVIGMAAGVYPSVRASRLTPREALAAT